jgi:hypothetical protein
MAAGQLFGSAPCARRRVRQRRPGGWLRLGREVVDDPRDGPNGRASLQT